MNIFDFKLKGQRKELKPQRDPESGAVLKAEDDTDGPGGHYVKGEALYDYVDVPGDIRGQVRVSEVDVTIVNPDLNPEVEGYVIARFAVKDGLIAQVVDVEETDDSSVEVEGSKKGKKGKKPEPDAV